MSCLQKNKRKINAAYQCTRPMKITAIQSSLLRDRSLFTGWGGLLFFRKVVGKKYDPPASTWQKKLWPSPGEEWKKLWPSPYLFFIFILFSLTKTIFFTRRCAPSSNYFASSGKFEKQYFFTLKQRRLTIHWAIRSVCVWWYFSASFFKWRPLMINRVKTKDGARGRNEICFLKATSFRALIKS